MRIVGGMQKLVCVEEQSVLLVLGWEDSYGRGFGISEPKVRTRHKGLAAWVRHIRLFATRKVVSLSSISTIGYQADEEKEELFQGKLTFYRMTRILVQRGSSSSSGSSRSSQQSAPQSSLSSREEDEVCQDPDAGQVPFRQSGRSVGSSLINEDEAHKENGEYAGNESRTETEKEKLHFGETRDPETIVKDLDGLSEDAPGSFQVIAERPYPPPPPPVPPPPMLSSAISSPRRTLSGGSNAVRIGSSRRTSAWPTVSTRTSQADSRPSSPNPIAEAEGYNSADEQNSCFGSSYCDVEREKLFEREIKRVKGFEVRRMIADGNCLFRAVADQVYGDPEAYDVARQMCIDYMERERDHFSQFITEGFLSYCKRKRRDKVYGNNVEIQAFSEMYNRPIHIYSYSTEPINIFHGGYVTDTPPLRLSYHQGNHYNSLVDPRRLTIGAGLGLSSLQEANVDKDQVKAAIDAQQNQQIDNALLAEGRFYSDLEHTEKEIEQTVMEASRIEYVTDQKFKQLEASESSTSATEPSSSGGGLFQKKTNMVGGNDRNSKEGSLSESMKVLLSMGFTYLQAVEACSIFGDDIDSMVCYLLDTGSSTVSPGNSRQKGKAAE